MAPSYDSADSQSTGDGFWKVETVQHKNPILQDFAYIIVWEIN